MALNDDWFYKNPPFLIKTFLLTFIWGDSLIMFPLILLTILLAIFSPKIGFIFYLLLVTIRFFIEIFYWLFQQFGPKTYRPYDFGLKKLGNNSIYILYQLGSTAIVFLSIIILTKIIHLW